MLDSLIYGISRNLDISYPLSFTKMKMYFLSMRTHGTLVETREAKGCAHEVIAFGESNTLSGLCADWTVHVILKLQHLVLKSPEAPGTHFQSWILGLHAHIKVWALVHSYYTVGINSHWRSAQIFFHIWSWAYNLLLDFNKGKYWRYSSSPKSSQNL